MQPVLLLLLSIIAYIIGLVIIVKVTPRLLSLSYDEGLFMGIAAAAILGALLAFGAIAITYAMFNGTLAIKILNFILLLGIMMMTARMSLYSFRAQHMTPGTLRSSRIAVGSYYLLLAAAALFSIVQLFIS
ncbi:MAG TPA: hypothetical protein VKV37_09580 [Ktedonobacteraceae bacterium]|jgi:hypothetical protein|nr:hypothetical protein [Ktedonobacteraceae bacterium]